jgi:copper chaperone NosL
MRNSVYIVLASLFTLLSCEVKPKEISYGEAACHFCRMTIVDQQHAAQLVTKKGKVFNFDATECMIHYLAEIDNSTIGLLLVTDYTNPGKLIPAESATYIISKEIPSPMGANLSAVSTITEAENLLDQREGAMYDWIALLGHLTN